MNTFTIKSESALMPVRQLNRMSRKGFSIIEVLAAIAVALVGVLGVMILVPYSVKLSRKGLDYSAAYFAALNCYDQFEIEGYRDVDRWDPNLRDDRGFPITVESLWGEEGQVPIFPRTPFSIDPMAITHHPSGPNFDQTGFPFVPNFPDSYRIPSVNLLQREPDRRFQDGKLRIIPNTFVPFDRAAADRLCLVGDDLVFNTSDNAPPEAGPAQVFDTLQGNRLRRQFEGQFSWSALAFPEPNARSHTYRIYFLIYKNRGFDLGNEASHMRFSRVQPPANPVPSENSLPPVSTIQLQDPIDETAVLKDDWVMLINRRFPGEQGPNAFDWQVAFCRVISASGNFLTMDGPGFDFNPATHQDTYAVHLKDVVMVFDRSMIKESQSSWNLKLF
jgi:prepilin-type N-terminal cleavage/methylation domain-containing protein